MKIRAFRPADTEAVVALWRCAGLVKDWNDPYLDIKRKSKVQPELFVVAEDHRHRVVGSVMAGYDGHRGWMNYLAAAPDARGLGIGRALVEHVERALLEVGCPKVNLQVRTSNTDVIEFYRRLGYAVDEAVSLGKRLITDTPGRHVRLRGRLIADTPVQARQAAEHLSTHEELTRQEPGCLHFSVQPTADPLIFLVEELFASPKDFHAHQQRTAASAWAKATASLRREYEVSGLPDENPAQRAEQDDGPWRKFEGN